MIVRDKNGKPIRLHPQEKAVVNWCQKKINANPTGYKIDISTLTAVIRQVQEQKFFRVPVADYVPLNVGEGAFAYDLLTWQSYATGGEFETGIIDTGGDNSRLASVDAGVAPVRVPIKNWAKQLTWSLFDLNYATKFNNWDLVTAKETARKTNWDLGIQKVAFLGLPAQNIPGLMTLPTSGAGSVTYDNATLTTRLTAMDATVFSGFLATLIGEYLTANANVQMPNRFLVPQSDYNGLAGPTAPAFPLISKLEMIEKTFKTITGRNDFRVLPNVYGMASNSGGLLSVDRYVLYNYAQDTIRMDIPVQYQPTLQQSVNGFHFQNVAYGQFTGVGLYRQQEVMYLDYEG